MQVNSSDEVRAQVITGQSSPGAPSISTCSPTHLPQSHAALKPRRLCPLLQADEIHRKVRAIRLLYPELECLPQTGVTRGSGGNAGAIMIDNDKAVQERMRRTSS